MPRYTSRRSITRRYRPAKLLQIYLQVLCHNDHGHREHLRGKKDHSRLIVEPLTIPVWKNICLLIPQNQHTPERCFTTLSSRPIRSIAPRPTGLIDLSRTKINWRLIESNRLLLIGRIYESTFREAASRRAPPKRHEVSEWGATICKFCLYCHKFEYLLGAADEVM